MAKQDVNFSQLDRLERIYSRAMPKGSSAFSELIGLGSTGGTNMDVLDNLDYLNAIGWMERAEPFGGSLLRAVFTGNSKLAEIYSKAELYFNSRLLKLPLTEPETAFMAQLAVNEHCGLYSLRRCGKCKGRGTVRNSPSDEPCGTCSGDGVVVIGLRSFARLSSLQALGCEFNFRRWREKIEPVYLALLGDMGERQTVAADYLFTILKRT